MSSTERMVGQAPVRLRVALIGVFAGDAEQQIEVHTKTSKLPSKLCWLTCLRYPVLLCAPGLSALLLYLWPGREHRAVVFPLVHAGALRRALFERLTLNKRRVFGLYVKATAYSLFFEKGLRAKGLLCVAPFLCVLDIASLSRQGISRTCGFISRCQGKL